MLKLKTRKSAKKRFTVSKNGKAKASKAFRGHLLTTKNRKRKRHLKQKQVLPAKESAKIRTMLPYD